MRDKAGLNFVDELTEPGSGSLPAACEVAVRHSSLSTRSLQTRAASRRPKRLVVPRGARESALPLAAPKALAAKFRRLPGAPQAAFRTARI